MLAQLDPGLYKLSEIASKSFELQALRCRALAMVALCLLVPLSSSAPDWHLGRHSHRYHPLSIDSKAIVSASANHHRHRMRTLATGASPAASEFVSASGTYFQVLLQRSGTPSLTRSSSSGARKAKLYSVALHAGGRQAHLFCRN